MTRSRREEAAVAFFGTWMISGLFLDGWAHEADKPETFFSPWHGILYSGFVAAVIWFSWDGRRHPETRGPSDRVITIGLVLFIVGAIGDGIWHEVFGIEVDLEALVSPSHLALFFGGFLMVTSPLRTAAADAASEPEPTWRQWFPQAITLMLAASLVLFFTQYLSVFEEIAGASHGGFAREFREINDLGSVLATNLILVMAMLFALWRWRPPFGTFVLLFTASSTYVSGLEGFEKAELILPFVVGGLVADAVNTRVANPMLVVSAGSFVLWCGFFAVADVSYGIAWSPELWSGAIVLSTAMSALLAGITRPSPSVR